MKSSTLWLPEAFIKLPSYQKSSDPVHFVQRVVCMEKIDGTNTRIGIPKDATSTEDIVIGGRTLLATEPGFQQPFLVDLFLQDQVFCDGLLELSKRWEMPITLYGETCGGKIQSRGFIYGSKVHFLLFAAKIGDTWLSYSQPFPHGLESSDSKKPSFFLSLKQLADELDLRLPPVLFEGFPEYEKFEELIDLRSQHSTNQGFQRVDTDTCHEGIVIWSDPMLLLPNGTPIVSKFKHPKRREYHERTKILQGDASMKDFAERCIQQERIEHAMQHLQERGRWSNDIEEYLPLLKKRIIQDIAREVPEYQEQLQAHGKKKLRKMLEEVAHERIMASNK